MLVRARRVSFRFHFADSLPFPLSPFRSLLFSAPKAWSTIIRTLIPNSSLLTSHLTRLRDLSSATEAVLFERQTFLVVARSRPLPARVQASGGGKLRRPKAKTAQITEDGDSGGMEWGKEHAGEGGGGGKEGGWEETEVDVGDSKRFEKISEMIKSFRIFLQK